MKRTVTSIVFLLVAFGLGALEAREGLMKLVVNESNARVSVYKLIDIANGRYESLLFDQDPRTTFVTLSADGRQYKLGDTAEFRISVTRTDSGVKIEFRSSSFVVRQILDFIRSEGSALADGLRVTFTVENISESDAAIGLRYLIDTWLGEKSGIHFITDKRQRISQETAIKPADADSWLATPGEKASFMIQFSGPGIDRPDRILLSNWKRLSDASWGYDANSQRNFTLVPYSINDSAVALFWEPSTLARSAMKSVSFVMGSFNAKGYPAKSSADMTATEQIFSSTVLGASPPDAATSMAADLVADRDLIDRIDRALAGSGSISEDELAAWRKILDRLEERKKGY
jgi:hypothetical protein